MPDRQFSDNALAGWYDSFCPWDERDDLAFYLELVMGAESVLDVGCGTGVLLHRARDSGHTGRLCGLDPGEGMLRQARRRTDVEWLLGDLQSVDWHEKFDLVVMSGHAFQVFITDDELHNSLVTIRSVLAEDGRFAFETRNPRARAWEDWTPENAVEVTTSDGTPVRAAYKVKEPVEGDLVHFTTTYTSSAWEGAEMSSSTLRFLDAASLSSFLDGAGLRIEEQFGDWNRGARAANSPEIITVAVKAEAPVRRLEAGARN